VTGEKHFRYGEGIGEGAKFFDGINKIYGLGKGTGEGFARRTAKGGRGEGRGNLDGINMINGLGKAGSSSLVRSVSKS